MKKQAFTYKDKRWESLRKKALQRDHFKCTHCGCECYGKKRNSARPVVDHIKTVKEHPHLAYELNNLRTLCASCDNKRHREKGMGIKENNIAVGIDGMPEGGEW